MSASTSSESMLSTVVMPIADIVPYWRNPRRISDEAVEAVMESIRQYGYNSPIVVDSERVIIMGHTRYSALRRLGVKEAPVVVASNLSPKKVKELRTIDNRTSENTRWDFDLLMGELGAMDQRLMASFFPEILEAPEEGESLVDVNAERQAEAILSQSAEPVTKTAEFICPHCFHQWEMKVSRQDVFAGELRVKE